MPKNQDQVSTASTRARCQCVAHVRQGITELHPELTITSIDGISSFHMISRESMLRGLLEVQGGGAELPLVRMFCGSRLENLWEDDEGTVHRIPTNRGANRAGFVGAYGQGEVPLMHKRAQWLWRLHVAGRLCFPCTGL